MITPLLGVLWALAFWGFALVLWPLSFFNHRLVWQADARGFPGAPKIHTTAAVVKRLAVRIIALAVLGYLGWTLFLAAMVTLASSASTMPRWFATSLMGWSEWFVLGIFLWLSAPVLAFGATRAAGSDERSTDTYREVLGLVGFVLVAYPILSFAATLTVMSIKISLVHSWATEGTVFWAPYYYRSVFRMYLPWLLVGGGMICVRRLIGDRSQA